MGGIRLNRRVWLLTTAITVILSVTATGTDFGASFKLGTTGIGSDVTMSYKENLNLRAGLSGFSRTFESDEDDITGKVNLLTVPVLADWHPKGGNFRVSGGIFLNNNKLSLSAGAGETVEINDIEYQVDDFSADLTFNRISPYLGIGFSNVAIEGRRLVFAFDLGVMFHGTPKLSARATASDPALQPELDRNLEIELEERREDVEPFKFYPVLTFGAMYRF